MEQPHDSAERARRERARRAFDGYVRRRDGGEEYAADDFLAEHRDLVDLLRPLLVALDLTEATGKKGETFGLVPERILGDYRLVRELGRGGMGVVWLAEQVPLRRRVALKVLPPGLSLQTRFVDRFRRESEAVAKLDHSGIVRIHGVGGAEGFHFIAMEYVDGKSLSQILTELRRLPIQELEAASVVRAAGGPAANWLMEISTLGREIDLGPVHLGASYLAGICELGARVCDALDHAHKAGVIHRDVKPSNILVNRSGTPVLIDFGLALVEDLPALTMTGEFAGTPYYVSPEQARARRSEIDARTDIYSLGVALFELVTLRVPFEGETYQEVLSKIMTAPPPRPSRFNSGIAGALEDVILKCLEKDPISRFKDCAEMAGALRELAADPRRLARRSRSRSPWSPGRLRRIGGMAALIASVSVAALVARSEAFRSLWTSPGSRASVERVLSEIPDHVMEEIREIDLMPAEIRGPKDVRRALESYILYGAVVSPGTIPPGDPVAAALLAGHGLPEVSVLAARSHRRTEPIELEMLSSLGRTCRDLVLELPAVVRRDLDDELACLDRWKAFAASVRDLTAALDGAVDRSDESREGPKRKALASFLTTAREVASSGVRASETRGDDPFESLKYRADVSRILDLARASPGLFPEGDDGLAAVVAAIGPASSLWSEKAAFLEREADLRLFEVKLDGSLAPSSRTRALSELAARILDGLALASQEGPRLVRADVAPMAHECGFTDARAGNLVALCEMMAASAFWTGEAGRARLGEGPPLDALKLLASDPPWIEDQRELVEAIDRRVGSPDGLIKAVRFTLDSLLLRGESREYDLSGNARAVLEALRPFQELEAWYPWMERTRALADLANGLDRWAGRLAGSLGSLKADPAAGAAFVARVLDGREPEESLALRSDLEAMLDLGATEPADGWAVSVRELAGSLPEVVAYRLLTDQRLRFVSAWREAGGPERSDLFPFRGGAPAPERRDAPIAMVQRILQFIEKATGPALDAYGKVLDDPAKDERALFRRVPVGPSVVQGLRDWLSYLEILNAAVGGPGIPFRIRALAREHDAPPKLALLVGERTVEFDAAEGSPEVVWKPGEPILLDLLDAPIHGSWSLFRLLADARPAARSAGEPWAYEVVGKEGSFFLVELLGGHEWRIPDDLGEK